MAVLSGRVPAGPVPLRLVLSRLSLPVGSGSFPSGPVVAVGSGRVLSCHVGSWLSWQGCQVGSVPVCSSHGCPVTSGRVVSRRVQSGLGCHVGSRRVASRLGCHVGSRRVVSCLSASRLVTSGLSCPVSSSLGVSGLFEAVVSIVNVWSPLGVYTALGVVKG